MVVQGKDDKLPGNFDCFDKMHQTMMCPNTALNIRSFAKLAFVQNGVCYSQVEKNIKIEVTM